MNKNYLVLGKIIPEREPFSHDGIRLFVNDKERGVKVTLLLGVINNQLTAKIIGDIGGQSIVFLKNMVEQAENMVLNANAFLTGLVLETDIVSVIIEPNDRNDGSIDYHTFGAHDLIATRQSSLDFQTIWKICDSSNGLPLGRALNDLKVALSNINDTPFYCYRAIETIKLHIGASHGEDDDKKQWDITRNVLKVERADIDSIKKLADELRHGKNIRFTGVEWRNIVNLTWDIVEKYVLYLQEK